MITALVFIADYIYNEKKEGRFPNKQYLFAISCQETVQQLREIEWLVCLVFYGLGIQTVAGI